MKKKKKKKKKSSVLLDMGADTDQLGGDFWDNIRQYSWI